MLYCTKKEIERSRVIMKKILLLFNLVVIVLGMGACGKKENLQEQTVPQEQIPLEQNTPDAAVIGYLNAFQAGRQDKANQYVTEDDIIYAEDAEDKDIATIQMLFGNMTYRVKSLTMGENNNAIVTTEITNVNMSAVMQAVQSSLKASSGSSNQTQEEILSMIQEAIEQNKDNTVTQTVEIEVVKGNDTWKVKTTTELLTAISGGVTPEGLEI